MKLELGNFPVRQIEFGSRTSWQDSVLMVHPEELAELLSHIDGLTRVDLEIVRPGEKARVIHLLDAVEPRVKVDGSGVAYPGFLADVDIVGSGRTHRLTGMSVLTSCAIPWKSLGGLLMVREGILEMSGAAAMYSPFSKCLNLVLVLEVADGREDDEYDRITRAATLKAADYLSQSVSTAEPRELECFQLSPADSSLPRVAYIYQIQSQGIWARTFLYGYKLDHLLPTLIHPNEVLDGALVSGNQVYQNFKIPTWLHVNNPVVRNLYARHGHDLNFVGIILSRGHFYSNEEKQRSANLAARLAKMIEADGVILTWEGGGNSIIEAMKTIQACEERGIRTTLLAYGLAGSQGDQYPLLYSEPGADAIISTGNTDEPVYLPAVERVVGGDTIRLKPEIGGVRLPAAGEINLEMTNEMYCAANQLGASPFSAKEY